MNTNFRHEHIESANLAESRALQPPSNAQMGTIYAVGGDLRFRLDAEAAQTDSGPVIRDSLQGGLPLIVQDSRTLARVRLCRNGTTGAPDADIVYKCTP